MAKLLLDENIPFSVMMHLKKAGYNTEHINRKCKGKSDKEVLEYALKTKRIILTLDCDFCDFKKIKHYGIIKVSGKLEEPEKAIMEVLKKFKDTGLKDIYIQIDTNKAFIEIKKYGKKRKLFFKQFQRIELKLECFHN